MAAVTEDPISLWLKLGALEKLEQVVLDGYGDQLYGKTSRIPQVNKFLRQVPLFQNKIDEIHRAVSVGNLREVQNLIDRKKLAFCRDATGASPMHKAVLFSQKQVIDYLLDRYPSVVHARDHRGRTPLHYAAVLPDGGAVYRMLLDHGADFKATDVYGNKAEYYLQAQDEMNLQVLKDGVDEKKPNKSSSPKESPKKRYQAAKNGPTTKEVGRSAKPAGSRIQIREKLNNCDLEALENLVIQGHGDRLLGESAPNLLVQDFLQMVPVYMERIYDIHRAVTRGRLRDVQTLLDRKKFALARDALGATPLHKAVMYGHLDVAQYIANHFPLAKDAKDLDGRSAVHYAASLKDNHETYNMLVSLGANPLALDYRGKTAEYYLQFPEHLHLDELIKQSQRSNANYMANNTNRIKAASPKRSRKSPYPSKPFFVFESDSDPPKNGESTDDGTNTESEPNGNGSSSFKMPKKTLFRSRPMMPPPRLKRLEINSANIKKWIKEGDVDKLEGAVMEGYGDKVVEQKTDSAQLQQYLEDHVPMMLRKIEAIHSAVSHDDLQELQNQLAHKDHMVLAKDSLGMAPIHRAVLMNKLEALNFLIDRFPETVNARDKEGRTALHYASAMSRGGTSDLFRKLLEAGADARIRDNQGRSAEYYRTHHVPIPNKLSHLPKGEGGKKLRSKSEPPPMKRVTKPLGVPGSMSLPQNMSDKINVWLQTGDTEKMKDFVQEGHGRHLLGRTSWNDDVRQYLKTLPLYLSNMDNLFKEVGKGDVEGVEEFLSSDAKFLKAKDDAGLTVIHYAVLNNQLEVLNYLLENHPGIINIKDRNGRTPLHIAGQLKNQYMYTVLLSAGADPMLLDNKGRTADFYTNNKTFFKTTLISSEAGLENAEENKTKNGPRSPRKVKKVPPKEEEEEKAKEEETKEDEVKEEQKDEEEKKEENEEKPPEENTAEMPEEKTAEEEEAVEAANEELKEEEDKKAEESEEIKEEGNVEALPETENADDNKENENGDLETPDKYSSESRRSSSGDRLNELIDMWIHDKDLLRLEHVVIAGQGDRLVGRSSDDRQVQEFLDLVPTYMARIRGVHDAVVRGNLGEVESVLTRKRFALSRDHLGASPLHLAVLHGHMDVVQYIISNFSEALDGPDNEGRTPLHYAAVVRDGGNCFRMLKRAGADEVILDKLDKSAEYYLTHPGSLTIRELLESYRIRDPEHKRPSQVNIWQRPPTDEIAQWRSSASFSPRNDRKRRHHHHHHRHKSSTEDEIEREPSPTGLESPISGIYPETIYPILFDRQNRDSAYLASVLGDALIKGLTIVSRKRPDDPVGYLATWLYQYASRNSHDGASTAGSMEGNENEASPKRVGEGAEHAQDTLANDSNEKGGGSPGRSPLRLLEEEEDDEGGREEGEEEDNAETGDEMNENDDIELEFDDQTKMKDEEGQTVLHFAASRSHPDGSFYGLISHAEMLLAERDSSYRTCRDIAEETGQQDNVAAIDRFVFDAFLQQRAPVIQMLAHEGYDHLINVSDNVGRDIGTVLQNRDTASAIALLKDVADFIKLREELHTFIRHGYLDGIKRLIKKDSTLITAKNYRERCALHIAILYEYVDLVQTLVKANSSAVHVPDNLGRTPLHYAMATEKVDHLAKILVKAGAMRTVRDAKMRTPSYYFIYKDEVRKLHDEELRQS